MNKKKILAIVLVIVVLLLGGASIYVATQLSTKQAVAPNAPISKPKAFEPCGEHLICSSTQAAGATQCTDSNHPDAWWCCPVDKTIKDGACVDFVWVTSSACAATGAATIASDVKLTKYTYANESENTAGHYTKETSISTINAGTTYVYHMLVENKGSSTISATLTDTLTGNNLDLLAFVDSSSTCSFNSSSRILSCPLGDIGPGKTQGAAFRVTVSGDATNGTVITNKGVLTYDSTKVEAINSITVSKAATTTIEGSKLAYENETANTAGSYSLKTLMETVAKSQTYVYTISLTNTGDATATGVTIKDSLAEVTDLTYVDKVSGCSWSVTDKLLTCGTTINPDETKTFSFRVKSSSDIANGAVITNTAAVTSDNAGSLTLTKDLPVSTVVGCNHSCTTAEECSTGLTCDTTTSKCRLAACLTESDCVCATVTTTTTTKTIVTASPTRVATAAATPTILPETGIFDLPGIAAFGGGLILAVVGILLAL